MELQSAGGNVKRDSVHGGSQKNKGSADECKRPTGDTDRDGAKNKYASDSRTSAVPPDPRSQIRKEHNVQSRNRQADNMGKATDPVHGGSQEGKGIEKECKRRKGDTDKDGARHGPSSDPARPEVQLECKENTTCSAEHGKGNVDKDREKKLGERIWKVEPAKDMAVSISVCTSSLESSVLGLLDLLRSWQREKPELIREVKFHPLPYNDIDKYTFKSSDPVDVMILCHSILNRRFSITDVSGALYDKYLDYCSSEIGKGKMAVIAHDFESIDDAANSSRQGAFRIKQPKAFDATSLAITCGNLAQEKPEIRPEDKNLLFKFIRDAAQYRREVKPVLNPVHDGSQKGKGAANDCKRSKDDTKGDSAQHQRYSDPQASGVAPKPSSQAETKSVKHHVQPRDKQGKATTDPVQGGSQDVVSERQISNTGGNVEHPHQVKQEAKPAKDRPVSISVCTSSPKSSVQGLLDLLRSWQRCEPIEEVKFHPLPYNDIDKYRFNDSDSVDVMILCHSIFNRRFAITDVMDALYDKYLDYCSTVIGKGKMAVIAYDFRSIDDTANSTRQTSFRTMQPKAFEATSLALTCGNLAQREPEIRPEHRTSLRNFIRDAKRCSREMKKEPNKKRHIKISVCSSLSEDSVSGFLQHLRTPDGDQQDLTKGVEFHQLRESDTNKHKFPKAKKVDVMILCYSNHNITDDSYALYEKFLHYCEKDLVKDKVKVAVIVYDVDDLDGEDVRKRMVSFKDKQPTASKLAGLAFTAGRLDGSQPDISKGDLDDLMQFLQTCAAVTEKKSWFQSITTTDGNLKDQATSRLKDKSKGRTESQSKESDTPL